MLHLGVWGGGSLTYKYIKLKQEINQVETRNISGQNRNTLKINFKSIANISNKRNISEKDCTYFGNLLDIYIRTNTFLAGSGETGYLYTWFKSLSGGISFKYSYLRIKNTPNLQNNA